MRRAAGEAIELRLMLDEGAGLCRVDPAQFQSALLNLVINARDAMPGGGLLTIQLRAKNRRPEGAAYSGSPAQYVTIVVRDTGIGMPPDVIEHAFEPFYTTKDVGTGSGLGLSQVYGFVTQSGGQVEIASKSGVGTEVTVYLPRVADTMPVADPTPGKAPSPPQRKTILVVEDDADVRDLAANLLRDLGYGVKTADDGTEAIAILRSDAAIDLVFSDIIMPKGIRGEQLAREARELRPGLRVLLTSGYAATTAALSADNLNLLRKPYNRDELAEAIRNSLG